MLGQESTREHIQIARNNNICLCQVFHLRRCYCGSGKDLPDPLKECAVCRQAEIDILPLCRLNIATAHHETCDGYAIVFESPDAAADRGVTGVMAEICNTPRPRALHGLALHGWFRDPRIS
jgi:hypothetical protein